MKTKMFTVGPAQMYEHTLKVRSNVVPYFRTSEFSNLMKDNVAIMKKLLDSSEDSEIVILTASGSGAMEATVINCFDSNDKLLIISGGTFGERFEKICNIHDIPFTPIKLGVNEQLTVAHLEPYANQGYTGLLVNHHETYTGQLYDMSMISKFCRENGLYLVVDAISSFLCDYYSVKDFFVDATIISSQKGLCLAPGLAIVNLSRRIIENKVMQVKPKTLYFDFKEYLHNISRGQTPFTPAVGVCFELNDMLHSIQNKGISFRLKEVRDRCIYFRDKLKLLPVTIPNFTLSNAITPVRFEKNIAFDFFEYLKNKKDIMVNPVGGELGKSSIRVAHIGDLSFDDYDILIEEMKKFFSM